jgi:hypothetical protein
MLLYLLPKSRMNLVLLYVSRKLELISSEGRGNWSNREEDNCICIIGKKIATQWSEVLKK